MTNYVLLAQIIVATSVAYVWIFRYDVIIKEFKEFGLSDLTRTFVGASKISLATLLGFFMLAAQYFHFKIKNPFFKRLPSLFLLILCVLITLVSLDII